MQLINNDINSLIYLYIIIVQRQKELSDQIKEERRKAVEVESELKERSVMERLKYSEAMQHIADLKQTITHLELKVN